MTAILVIDDYPHTAPYIRGIVDPTWEVFSAPDGLTGVELVRQHPEIELVLLDIKMPDPDGYYVATQLRRFHRTLRIIPYTAVDPVHEDPHLQQYMRELGCTEVLLKGTHPRLIQERLHTALVEVPQVHDSALLTQLFRVTDAHYRACRRAQRWQQETVIVYTASTMGQIGLKHLLETVGQVPTVVVLVEPEQVNAYLAEGASPIVVTTPTMYDDLCGFVSATTTLCPLVVTYSADEALSLVQQFTAGAPFPCWSVLVDAGTLLETLPTALTALRQGTSFVDPLLKQAQRDYTQRVRQHLATRTGVTLNDHELRLIHLHQQHLDVPTIAAQLGTSTSNVYQQRTRLYKKLGVTTMDAVLQLAVDTAPTLYGGPHGFRTNPSPADHD